MRVKQTSAGAMIVATTFFGVGAALLSGFQTSGLAVVSLLLLGHGVVLVLVSLFTRPERSLPWKIVLGFAVLNLAQLVLYFYSLRWAPVGIAAALHLTSPILLMLGDIFRKKRSFGQGEILSLACIFIGIAAATLLPGATEGGSYPLAGMLAALASAVGVACMFSLIAYNSEKLSIDYAQGIGQLLGGVILLPFLLLSPPPAEEASQIVATGALLYAPGAVFVWFALARISTSGVGAIALLEAVTAVIAAAIIFNTPFLAQQAVAIIFILSAAWIEIRRDPKHAIGALPEAA